MSDMEEAIRELREVTEEVEKAAYLAAMTAERHKLQDFSSSITTAIAAIQRPTMDTDEGKDFLETHMSELMYALNSLRNFN